MNKSRALSSALLLSIGLGCGGPADVSVSDDDVLARFEIGTNTVEFLDDGAGGVFVTELTPAGPNEHFVVKYDGVKSPLDWYLDLAPEGAPVPEALVALQSAQFGPVPDLGLRPLTTRHEAPFVLEARADDVAEIAGGIGKKVSAINTEATGSCGSNGGAHFENRYCGRSGGGQIERCGATFNGGNSVWFHHIGSTGSAKRKNVLTITAACGVGAIGDVEYQVGNTWYFNKQLTIPEDFIRSTTHFGAAKYRRRVDTERTASHHGFRTVAAFADAIMLEQP